MQFAIETKNKKLKLVQLLTSYDAANRNAGTQASGVKKSVIVSIIKKMQNLMKNVIKLIPFFINKRRNGLV